MIQYTYLHLSSNLNFPFKKQNNSVFFKFFFIVSRQALENAKVMHVCTDECFKIQDISIIPSDFLGKVLCRGFYTIQYAYFGSIVYWCKTLPFYMDRRNKIGQKTCFIPINKQ